MKLNKICAALAACGLAFGMSVAGAQTLSGDKIMIGFITDMSSLYSDIDGPGGVEAIRHGDRRHAEGISGQEDRSHFGRPSEQGRYRIVEGARVDRPGRRDVIIGGTNSATALRWLRRWLPRRRSPTSRSVRQLIAPDQRGLLAVHRALRVRHDRARQGHRRSRRQERRQELVFPDR